MPTEATPPSRAPKPGLSRRWLLAILALTFLFVLMPFLFWQATWFGRPLNDAQLSQSLHDNEHPREIQHGLSQIADRILSANAAVRDSARPYYPDVISIAHTGGDELRITAAWVMGQDNSVPEFHQQLLLLLKDANPMVRRNAALALVRFGDTSGIAEIRAILQPYAMPAGAPGRLDERLKPGEEINPGTLLGHIDAGKGNAEVRSLVPGKIDRWLVADGSYVTLGQPILSVTPSDAEVWEALRALYVMGDKQDLPAVEQISSGATGAPLNVRKQAELTAQAINSRG